MPEDLYDYISGRRVNVLLVLLGPTTSRMAHRLPAHGSRKEIAGESDAAGCNSKLKRAKTLLVCVPESLRCAKSRVDWF